VRLWFARRGGGCGVDGSKGAGRRLYRAAEGPRRCDSSSNCKLGTLFFSVKYVLVSVKLVCVYVKLLKI
jgi:hypothetical protein